jgi:4-hydroxy-3-methylbut-2-enyl diphosphate reductase
VRITIAKDAGYCSGVRDAVNTAYDSTDEFGDVYMLGDIVHNERVVEDLANAGTKVVKSLSDIPKNSPVLFRAHGTVNDTWSKAKQNNLNIIDATCPLVHEIHHEVIKLEKDGRKIIIIGDHGHDEVIAIADQVKNAIVIATEEEAMALKKMKSIGIVSQSTQMIENVQKIINVLLTKTSDLHFVNTICYPTKRNQEQIKELATQNDIMIIIGSFTSANSKRLTELSLERNKKSYQVEKSKDLKHEWFTDVETVGISAGASTPEYLIGEVKDEILNISKGIEK